MMGCTRPGSGSELKLSTNFKDDELMLGLAVAPGRKAGGVSGSGLNARSFCEGVGVDSPFSCELRGKCAFSSLLYKYCEVCVVNHPLALWQKTCTSWRDRHYITAHTGFVKIHHQFQLVLA